MILCDAHADTISRMAEKHQPPYDLSLERLRKGGVNLQVLALFVGLSGQPDDIKAHTLRMLEALAALKREGWTQADDPVEAREGESRFMLSIEGCELFDSGLHTVSAWRRLGVRMAGITWNYVNRYGTPASANQSDGLTQEGFHLVRELQHGGIAVDLSHLNIPGFYDVLRKSEAPPLASHSCCRALRDHPRNLTDEQLKDLFAAGGYLGVNFYPSFLAGEESPCGIDTVIDHIDRMHQLGGQGKVGFGSDFDGITTKPEGLDNPEDFPALLEGLRRRGYRESDLEDIAGLNFLSYYRRIS